MFIGRVWAEVLNLRAGNVESATSALMFGPTKLEQLFGCYSAPGGTRGEAYSKREVETLCSLCGGRCDRL